MKEEKSAEKKSKKQKKPKKWVRRRHKVVRDLANLVIYPFSRIKYGLHVEKIKNSRKKQYLLLYNHQTPMDQFFVGMTVREPVYYLATEDIFSNGLLSKLLKFLVAPIPIKKQSLDVRAVLNCLKVAKEGGSIAIAPEGNRTYSGRTCYIAPSIASLARKLQIPIAFVRIEGGFGVQPRFSDRVRKGRVNVFVSKILDVAEVAQMDDAALYETIVRELSVDEANDKNTYRSKHAAEYVERAAYVCPDCGFSTFYSQKDLVTCEKCKKSVRYLQTTALEGVGFDFPFRYYADWYDYQNAFVNKTDTELLKDSPLFTDTVKIYAVGAEKKTLVEKNVMISLFGDRIETNGEKTTPVWDFSTLKGAVVAGRNKLNLYDGAEVWQIRGDKRFNALKYVNFYFRRQNQLNAGKEKRDDEFLGL